MDVGEREQIEKAVQSNFEVRKLYLQHRRLENRLDTLSRRSFLTSKEQVEQKKLKHQKLRGKEKLLAMVQEIASVA